METKKARKLARRMKFQGMDISIETDKGQFRHWYDPHNGTEGSQKMEYPYGYIRMTDGYDGEHVDAFIGPDEDEKKVYIIRQNKAPDFKFFDEEKIMLGYQSEKDAKQAYLMHYNSPKFFESIRSMDIEGFKEKYVSKALTGPPQGQSPQDPLVPMFDPYDMNIPQSVQTQLASIGSMSDKDLLKLSQAVWGEGYEYRPISKNQVRAELRGWLRDQIEWLKMNPMAQMLHQQGMQPIPAEMPHSLDSSQGFGPGAEDSNALLREANLDGKLDQTEQLASSPRQGY